MLKLLSFSNCVCMLTAVDPPSQAIRKTRAVTEHNTQKDQTSGNCKYFMSNLISLVYQAVWD